MNHEGILAVYEAGPEAVIKLRNTLSATIFEQSEQIAALQERVKALEEQLNKNSRNSNKPPNQISCLPVRCPARQTGLLRHPGACGGRDQVTGDYFSRRPF
ncbi:MAG: hypothetical protein DDT29_00793 [Dehalococcoidia bacterium]|nr:hypothetical protein [Bacillota bacterium]